jgi:hypothetical protein
MRRLILALIAVWISFPAAAQDKFLPEQLVWAVPLVRTIGCIVAERAVRDRSNPRMVCFDSCANEDKFQTSMSDNLKALSVSGTAYAESHKIPFTVELWHNYETDMSESGFEVKKVIVAH